jgi:hypothetical protein
MSVKEIVIRNLSKRPLIFILTHDEVCKKVGQCFCKNGKPHTIHALVGVDTPAIAAALQCKELVNAVRTRQVVVVPIDKAKGRPARPGTEASVVGRQATGAKRRKSK